MLDSSVNVISVEWSNLAAGPDYPPAARNTQPVSMKSNLKHMTEPYLYTNKLKYTDLAMSPILFNLGWSTCCRIH